MEFQRNLNGNCVQELVYRESPAVSHRARSWIQFVAFSK